MIVPDANLLIYAYDEAFPDHPVARRWWEDVMNGGADVIKRDHAQVGQAEGGIGDVGTREIECAESGVGVDDARKLERPLGIEGFSEAGDRGCGGHSFR